jgi:hypothetical protein
MIKASADGPVVRMAELSRDLSVRERDHSRLIDDDHGIRRGVERAAGEFGWREQHNRRTLVPAWRWASARGAARVGISPRSERTRAQPSVRHRTHGNRAAFREPRGSDASAVRCGEPERVPWLPWHPARIPTAPGRGARTMTKYKAGVWIDHRKALIVVVTSAGERTTLVIARAPHSGSPTRLIKERNSPLARSTFHL